MLLLIPTGVDYQTRRYPVVTFSIMGICTAVYLVTLVLWLANGSGVDEWVFDHLWLTPAFSPWWTYFTSMFVHGGFFHLLGNMLYLFLFGCVVEDLIGRIAFVCFYLSAGIAAAFAEILVSPTGFASEIPFGGASGAITGCIAGFLLFMLRSRIEFKWIFIFFFRVWSGDFMLPAWLVISAWFAKDLLFAVLSAMNEQQGGGVAFAAHVGGFLWGLAFISVEKLRQSRVQPSKPDPATIIETARYAARVVSQPEEVAAYYLHMNGEQAGPFTPSQINGMLKLGSVPADAFYWIEGMDGWQSISDWQSG